MKRSSNLWVTLIVLVLRSQHLVAYGWQSCGWDCKKTRYSAARREKIVARGYPYGNDYTGGPYVGTADEPYARAYHYQSRWPFTFGYMAVESGKKVPSATKSRRRARCQSKLEDPR